jgi:hypothetical protein
MPLEEHCLIPIFQDECTNNSNDGRHHIWCSRTNRPLRKKGPGQGIMISELMTPAGPLQAPDELLDSSLPDWGIKEGLRLSKGQATVQLECGGDEWFNGYLLLQQTLCAAIPLFEAAFPGCRGVFFFHNGTIHSRYAKDALRGQSLALNAGYGEAVRDIYDYLNNVPQKMTDKDGKSLGLRHILMEHGLWRRGMRVQCGKEDGNLDPQCLKNCTRCARGVISEETDFKEQRTSLEEEVTKRGHYCVFLPKFHPETIPIQYYYRQPRYTH